MKVKTKRRKITKQNKRKRFMKTKKINKLEECVKYERENPLAVEFLNDIREVEKNIHIEYIPKTAAQLAGRLFYLNITEQDRRQVVELLKNNIPDDLNPIENLKSPLGIGEALWMALINEDPSECDKYLSQYLDCDISVKNQYMFYLSRLSNFDKIRKNEIYLEQENANRYFPTSSNIC